MTDNKDLQLMDFVFGSQTVRSGIAKDGSIWFVAKDVCDVLEIVNSRDAVSRLDPEDRSNVFLNDGNRGNPNMTIISEAGLYHLVMSSEKKEAKTFRRWVLHDVLPEIRKNGYYGSPLPKHIKRCCLNADRIEQGYFSVIHELSIILGLRVEDPHHIVMRDKSITPKKDKDGNIIYPDICPDISVGRLFSIYLESQYPAYATCYKHYSHTYPDGRVVQARQYENKLLGIFREYVETFWLKDKAPKYFSDKDPKIAEVLQKQLK